MIRNIWMVLVCSVMSTFAWAQGGPGVDQAAQQDVSRPLAQIPPVPPKVGLSHRPSLHPHPLGPVSVQPDPVAQISASPLVATTSGLNFAGVGSGDYGYF